MLAAEGVHFGKDFCGFGLEGVALLGEVVFGVFAGPILEVEVAEIVVDDLFALAKVVETCLFDHGFELRLWPEDVGEAGEQKNRWGDDGLEFHNSKKDAWPSEVDSGKRAWNRIYASKV